MADKKREGFRFFGDDWGKPTNEQVDNNRAVVSDWWNQVNQTRPGVSLGDVINNVSRDTWDWRKRGVDLLAANPSGGPTQAAAYGLSLVRDKMLESGGTLPPTAAKAAATPGPNMFTKAPAAMQAPAQPKTPLQEVLANMVAANPDAKLTFGQLQKLGSVFPGVPTTSKLSGKDAAIQSAMGYADMQLKAAVEDLEARKQSGELDDQAANEIYTKVIQQQMDFRARLGVGEKSDDTALADAVRAARNKE